jgi:hypothetical protein
MQALSSAARGRLSALSWYSLNRIQSAAGRLLQRDPSLTHNFLLHFKDLANVFSLIILFIIVLITFLFTFLRCERLLVVYLLMTQLLRFLILLEVELFLELFLSLFLGLLYGLDLLGGLLLAESG